MHSVTANEGKRCLFLRNSGGYGKCEAGGCEQSDATTPDKDAAPAPKPVEGKTDDDTKNAAPAPKMEGGVEDAKGYCVQIYVGGSSACASYGKNACDAEMALGCKWDAAASPPPPGTHPFTSIHIHAKLLAPPMF
jgi:hypothetical protein